MRKIDLEAARAWENPWYDTAAQGGRFVRTQAGWRNWVTPDGSPGPSGQGGFPAESGRYHLYVSLACPWAHRCLIARELKGLQPHITVSYTRAYMGPESWSFEPEQGLIFRDDYYVDHLWELYRLADPDYSGRATVPVLWDKRRQTIVSNESAEILRMFNSAFAGLGTRGPDLYPEDLRAEIDELNAWIYPTLNDGVYKAGFASTQAAYEEAVHPVFDTLDRLEQRLATRRWLTGERLTEADIRLFTTLVRFDAVYHGHFKCNLRRVQDYPNLWGFTRDLYQLPGIAGTVDIEFNKRHYYGSHDKVNPTLIVPVGPLIDFGTAHGRDVLGPPPLA